MSSKIILEKHKDYAIVRIYGRLFVGKDNKNLASHLEKLYDNKKIKRVVLDVTETDFMDSDAISNVMYYYALFTKDEGYREVIIVNANKDPYNYISRCIEFLGIDKIIPIKEFFEE